MLLSELGQEYLEGEKAIRARIKALRAKLKGLTEEEQKEVKTRIFSLYQMARDAKETGNYLKRYYDIRKGRENV